METITRQEAKAQGLTHYFTGKPCKHGHISKRLVRCKHCCECLSIMNKTEKVKQQQRASYLRQKAQPGYWERKRPARNRWSAKNRDKNNARQKLYALNNPEKIKETRQKSYERRMALRPLDKLLHQMRNLMRSYLRRKSASTIDLLGCNAEKFRQHLEDQFVCGMGWENRPSWHMDHIRPCASFSDLEDNPAQQAACFFFGNFQPLWASDNYSKQDTWSREMEADWIVLMRSHGFTGELFPVFDHELAAA